MTINPNAILIPGECLRCHADIEYYVVPYCDQCIEDRLPETPCEECGLVSKHHPCMSRFRDGRWKDDDGNLYPCRYWCEEHKHLAS